MRHVDFDVLYVADFSADDGNGEAAAEEIAALAAAGYRCGVLPLAPRVGRRRPLVRSRALHARAERFRVVSPDSNAATRLAVVLGGHDIGRLALPTGTFRAERAVLVADAPPVAADGALRYDPAAALARTRALFSDAPAAVAPRWQTVRVQLEDLLDREAVAPGDWPTVASAVARKPESAGPAGRVPRAGRTAPPLRDLWPDSLEDLLRFYPATNWLDICLAGVPQEVTEPLHGRMPANWQVFGRGAVADARFYARIEFFADSCHPLWPHRMSREVAVALAHGVIPVVRFVYAPLLGEAALYLDEPGGIVETVTPLHRDPEELRRMREAGREVLEERFAPARVVERVAETIGPPRRRFWPFRRPDAGRDPPPAARARRRDRVLFLTSNGTGLGHITRLLAVARHMPADLKPIFATFSQSSFVVRRAGYHVEHLPFHLYAECDVPGWNRWLAEELGQMLDFYAIRTVLFDGNVPYDGLLRAIGPRPEVTLVWCRRAMWQHFGWDHLLRRSIYFDAIVEPGELSAPEDRGATAHARDGVTVVPPVTMIEETDLLDRAEARRRLDLDPERPAVLLQLGSGNNASIAATMDEIISELRGFADFQIVIAEWLMTESPLDLWPDVRRLRHFPNAVYLRAFDFVISAAGYNSFHELLRLGVPAIFCPTEVQELDRQATRALFAQREGLALCLRRHRLHELGDLLPQIMDGENRRRLAEAGRQRLRENGAPRIADLIARQFA